MKKLFITGALLLSAVTFTTVQAKENQVEQAEGANMQRYCRYAAIFEATEIDGYGYGSIEFQYAYRDYYRDCMGI